MTREETKTLIRVLVATYPKYYQGIELTSLVDAWYIQMKDDSYSVMQNALVIYNRSNRKGFPPTIGDLVGIANDMILDTEEDSSSNLKVWSSVEKAIRNSTYHATEEFEKLPEIAKRVIGSPDALRSMATQEGANFDVMRSNILKGLEQVKAREKTERAAVVLEHSINRARVENNLPEKHLSVKTNTLPLIE